MLISQLFETQAPTKNAENIKAFFAEFKEGTASHPFARQMRLHGNVGVELDNLWDESVSLNFIVSFGEKGTGEASQTLKWLCGLADKHHVELVLDVEPVKAGSKGKDLNKRDLTAWYGRHGFVKSRGQMIRKPKD